jgi:hypothetical protein
MVGVFIDIWSMTLGFRRACSLWPGRLRRGRQRIRHPRWGSTVLVHWFQQGHRRDQGKY